MPYDRDSFLAGLAVGRTLWRPQTFLGKEIFSFTVQGDPSKWFTFRLTYPIRDVVVDWGDGTSTAHIDSNYYYNPEHKYSEAKPYQITINIYDYLNGFNFYSASRYYSAEGVLSLDSPIPRCCEYWYFGDCSNLRSIPGNLLVKQSALTSCTQKFEYCSSLAAIPSGLFDPLVNCRDFTSVFSYCSAITEIPSGLFAGCASARVFRYAFSNCTGLEQVASDLFSGLQDISDLYYTFSNCTGIVSAVPELWLTHPNTNHEGCFYLCSNAANYASIPSGWKW